MDPVIRLLLSCFASDRFVFSQTGSDVLRLSASTAALISVVSGARTMKFLPTITTIIFIVSVGVSSFHAQTESPNSITPKLFEHHELCVPACDGISDLMMNQNDLPIYQELKVQRRSIQVHKEPLPKELDAFRWPQILRRWSGSNLSRMMSEELMI
jgi:hypothetical protein